MKPEIDISISLRFASCSKLSTVAGDGGRQAVNFALSADGKFLRYKKDEAPALEIDPDPFSYLDAGGNMINSREFAHPLLARPLWEHESLQRFNPAGDFGFIHESRSVSLSQTGDANNQKNFDALANGQLALAERLYPLLLPKFGYVDVWGENRPADKIVRKTELRKVFWANFYNAEYVQKFSRDFFLGAPGWKKEVLCDGGILYVATESFQEWWKAPPVNIVEYFRAKIPTIKSYRARVNWDA